MTKSELIERVAEQQDHLPVKDIELAVKLLLDHMSDVLATGVRIEIRGFGSFSLHYRAPRMGRNPKTGETVPLDGKYVRSEEHTAELQSRGHLVGRPLLETKQQRRRACPTRAAG